MLCLAIDTSTPTVVTGVVATRLGPDGEPGATETLAEQIMPDCRQHNEHLIAAILDCLTRADATWDDIEAIVVGCGPGPFTGLRVGMATAAALGHARGIPVFGVVSHDSIAAQIYAAHPEVHRVVVATDARRRVAYWSVYEDGSRIEGPQVSAPGVVPCCGSDVVNVPGSIAVATTAATVDLSPMPAALVSCADLSSTPEPLTPYYLRRPDAVPPKPLPPSKVLRSASGSGVNEDEVSAHAAAAAAVGEGERKDACQDVPATEHAGTSHDEGTGK